jgi:hypothetical protein
LVLRSVAINGSRINALVFKNRAYNDSPTHRDDPEFLLPLTRARDIHLKHRSIRLEHAHVDWIKRLIYSHGKRHPADFRPAAVESFLT